MSILVLSPGPAAAIRRWADFSACRRYRYLLGREWDPMLPRAFVCGLNASKADERSDDMTVTKLIGFAHRWGAGSFELVNLYPFVATDPNELRRALRQGDVHGARADRSIAEASARAQVHVVAWGATPLIR